MRILWREWVPASPPPPEPRCYYCRTTLNTCTACNGSWATCTKCSLGLTCQTHESFWVT